MKKILICGLPGSGKTTLAKALAPLITGVVFDGDAVRALFADNDFSPVGREVQADRMSRLCDLVTASGNFTIASFICPTSETRDLFGADFTIWMDRNGSGQFADTQALWRDPDRCDLRVTNGNTPEYWAERAASLLLPRFLPSMATALVVGRWQPFTDHHEKLIEEKLERHGQVCIGVRYSTVEWPYERVRARIEERLTRFRGRFIVIPLPNVTVTSHDSELSDTVGCAT